MTEKQKTKYLNKFKLIEKLNGYTRLWWNTVTTSCKFCRFDDSCIRTMGEKKRLYFDDETELIYESYKLPSNNCVEFLRSPKAK